MAWTNEPVIFTILTIHFHVVNIIKMKGNTKHRFKRTVPAHMAKSLYETFSAVTQQRAVNEVCCTVSE